MFDCECNIDIKLSDVFIFFKKNKRKFDVIFADPPYMEVGFHSIKEKVERKLKSGGIFCMEMKKEPIDGPNVRVKYFGSTQVVFWRAAA